MHAVRWRDALRLAALRAFDQSAAPLGRLGSLEVRLARSVDEVKRAQKLRYRVFYEEMSAVANVRAMMSGRDRDTYDAFCDHLLVFDHESGTPEIIGTYRLLRQEVAKRRKGFYSAGEFEVDRLIARHGDRSFLELGRSCVLKPYRFKDGRASLARHLELCPPARHRRDIGCASLEGTDTASSRPSSRSSTPWRRRPTSGACRRSPDTACPSAASNRRRRGVADRPQPAAAHQGLSPPRRLCLRGSGDRLAVRDDRCLLVLPLERISSRYINYCGADATRHAA